jgi:FlaA1/EpsC-like NDP-sugar epimerase
MGTPVKIVDMAKDLIRLSGKEPEKDIQIIFTGLRPGEKIYEELLTEGEEIIATKHEKIMCLTSNNCNGLPNQDDYKAWLSQELNDLYHYSNQFDAQAIKRKLRQIVPDYVPQNGDHIL